MENTQYYIQVKYSIFYSKKSDFKYVIISKMQIMTHRLS